MTAGMFSGSSFTLLARRAAGACDECGAPAQHGEHWDEGRRWWCEAHVPWSGHYEHCPYPCARLIAAAYLAQMEGRARP